MLTVDCESCGSRYDADPIDEHRVMCGDATVRANIDRLLGETSAAAIVSDPPYGMGFDATWFGSADHVSPFAEGAKAEWDQEPFDPSALLALGVRDVALFGANYYCTKLPEPGTWWVWDKRTSEAADVLLGIPFELIWMTGKRAHRIIRYNWAAITARERNEPGSRFHPTQKPVELATRAIRNSSELDQVVFDPFAGSGTTIVGAYLTGRRGFGADLDPAYVDVICRRYQALSGEAPVLEATGKTVNFTD